MSKHFIVLMPLLLLISSISPASGEVEALSFSRMISDPGSRKPVRLEMGWADYICQDDDLTFQVTLYPMQHVGDQPYFENTQKDFATKDLVLFESARLPGFFGEPFEHNNQKVYNFPKEKVTEVRLQSIQAELEKFIEVKGAPPKKLRELFLDQGERKYMASMLYDTWGSPLELKYQGGGFVVSSLGKDRKVSGDDLFAKPGTSTAQIVGLVDALRGLYVAKAAEFEAQAQYESFNYLSPNMINADVAIDMLFTTESVIEEGWRYRNEFAPLKLRQLITTGKVKSGSSVGIVYGVGHMKDFHNQLQNLFVCQFVEQSWHPIFWANPPHVEISQKAKDARMTELQEEAD